MRIIRETLTQKVVTADTDQVIASAWIPTGGRLISATIQMHAMAFEVTKIGAFLYGTNAFLLPLPDPDTPITANVLWDRLVPKDVEEGPGAYDLDTTAADTTPEYELGEIDYTSLFGGGPFEIKGGKRRRMLTAASGAALYDGSTVDTISLLEKFTLRLKGTPRVYEPSCVAVGFSSPLLDDTTSTESTSPLEDQWINLQYAAWTLEQALVEALGQAEAGAESPWEDASAFLLNYAEPDVFEDNAARFTPQAWDVYAKARFVVEVPGTPGTGVLTTD